MKLKKVNKTNMKNENTTSYSTNGFCIFWYIQIIFHSIHDLEVNKARSVLNQYLGKKTEICQ